MRYHNEGGEKEGTDRTRNRNRIDKTALAMTAENSEKNNEK